ncbi:hypothetical protein AVEN_183211-1 [Araneus ventricosus]|uniref:Uncharacterized protein n=1 Tax=Araneus ventricosus TaxID=182803 RepID=A0A4Y2H5F7_ARAVE|nr:hypothetical protein AVEN_223266-1 [Araneus ventricosus]GBM59484.1 hypothetical protein AVEN_257608-1 [Araneus ventricosus]GBM59524.1 hypothetical protein AVEN_115555-1 [Araneus ventricosus]GBM59554.1 hypothetical protein AVEN_183211-1 [Araneus ventricosus]
MARISHTLTRRYSPVIVINNSLVVIGFDEMSPQNKKAMTMKRCPKRNLHQPRKLCKPFILYDDQSNTVLNPVGVIHTDDFTNECLKTKTENKGYSR